MWFAPDLDFRGREPRNRMRRGQAIVLTGIVHALVLLVVLVPTRAATPAVTKPNLVTFDAPLPGPVAQDVAKPKQPKKVPSQPRDPAPMPPVEIAIVTLHVSALLKQADAQAATGGCDLTAPVQAALQSSSAVQQALPTIPVERRSVANAIAIWNQTWVKPDAELRPAVVETIRSAVTTTIAAASEACRLQPQGGPRLIYLPGTGAMAGGTTVLALGSGDWTWQQVADSAQPDFEFQLAQAPLAITALSAPLPPLIKTAFLP